MNVESDLPGRLSALADELTWPDPSVSVDGVHDRRRRQRRARAGLAVTIAGVLAVGIGAPMAIGALSAGPDTGGVPAAPRTTALPSESPESVRPDQAILGVLADPISLTFPPLFVDEPTGEGILGPFCPDLSGALAGELDISVLPGGSDLVVDLYGSGGCTWNAADGPVPQLGLAFVLWAPSAADVAYAVIGGRDLAACPQHISYDADQALVCAEVGAAEMPLVLVSPDARDAGVWVLSATGSDGHTAARALEALIDATGAVFA